MQTTKADAERFKVLTGDTRLAIIEQLKTGTKTVGELAEILNVSQPVVSQNLRILKAANLVEGKKDGNRVSYSLKPDGLIQLHRELAGLCLCGCDCCLPTDIALLEAYQAQLEEELSHVTTALSKLKSERKTTTRV